MMNKVILAGNLGDDPELREAGSSVVCNLSVATNERYKTRDGEDREETEWHNVEVWGRQGEACAEYLSKGSKVLVEGKIKTYKWEDRDTGEARSRKKIRALFVKFLDGSGGGNGGGSGGGGRGRGQSRNRGGDSPDEDFDISF